MATAKTTAKKKAPATTKAKVVKKTKSEGPESFAVFATGGKQYRVSPGQTLRVEKILGEHKEGDKLVFDNVLLVDDGAAGATVGTPFIPGAAVNATLTKIDRHKKVLVIKYKQKSRYFKKNGHRQPYFEITIDSIK